MLPRLFIPYITRSYHVVFRAHTSVTWHLLHAAKYVCQPTTPATPISAGLQFYHEQITSPLTSSTYDQACSETLESLSDTIEEFLEAHEKLKKAEVTLGDGVLTLYLGEEFGTYVINRQKPNLQIWFSSPMSGPKRYDFVDGHWVYKHDGIALHALLEQELCQTLNMSVDLSKCAYATPK